MSDGDGSRDDDVEDSASSTAGSASRADIEAIVSERVGLLGKDIKDTLVKDIQGKLESFRANVLDMMNSRLNQIESNLPIPAPQPVLVQQSLGKGRSDPPPTRIVQTVPQARAIRVWGQCGLVSPALPLPPQRPINLWSHSRLC